jgi:N utilization substance protein B
MGQRRQARELALKALYQVELTESSPEDAMRALFSSAAADDRIRDFARAIVRGVQRTRDQLDSALEAVLTNWSIGRLSRIDHTILRMAAFELLELHDIPLRVTIDEAIELAKRYGDNNSAQFVNGVLDQFAESRGLKNKGEERIQSKHN